MESRIFSPKTTEKYLVLFHTHSGALGYEQDLKRKQIPCQLMPSPRSLSSSCGICLTFELEVPEDGIPKDHPLPQGFVNDHVDRMYVREDKDQYHMIYEDPQ